MDWSIRPKPGGTPVGTTAPAEGIGTQYRLLPTGRLEAFSDGVFAIAITLLVLELHVPTGQEALVRGLEHEWPRYLGYFVSFAFIGGVWIAHSNLTRFIKAADADLMRLLRALPDRGRPRMPQPDRHGADHRHLRQQADELGDARGVRPRRARHPDGRLQPLAGNNPDQPARVRVGAGTRYSASGAVGTWQARRPQVEADAGRQALAGRR
jgi:Endosomal/lysosomal potassium channel TMEM175